MKNFLTLLVLALSCSLLVASGANIQQHLSKRAIKPKTRSNALGGMLRQKQARQSDDMGMAKKQCDALDEDEQVLLQRAFLKPGMIADIGYNLIGLSVTTLIFSGEEEGGIWFTLQFGTPGRKVAAST